MVWRFSALQRAENSSMRTRRVAALDHNVHVSVLFSEPKIPQCAGTRARSYALRRFSALQRAENSSIQPTARRTDKECGFSALQRAENSSIVQRAHAGSLPPSFSALQRAENSSILKALKIRWLRNGFSALQRAENSSIPTLAPASIHISDRDDHASSFLSLPGASP